VPTYPRWTATGCPPTADDICRQLAGPRQQRLDGLPFAVTEDGCGAPDEAVTYDCSIHAADMDAA
jgi:hypothetical protein